jgi:hypothetical protein
MLDKLNIVEKIVEEVIIDILVEKVMSTSILASLMRGVQASLLISCGSGPSQVSTEKRTKHRDDLANAKLIPTIFTDYILPLADAVSRDSLPRYFEYTMATTYLPKGIHAV